MKPTQPGIASANRPRLGAFADLVGQIVRDESALDGLIFAYAELPAPERRALAHAVLQDAEDPTHALVAFLAVEDNLSLRRRLTGLIQKHGRVGRSARLAGTEAQGEACLIQIFPGWEAESLRIAWYANEIKHIEIESRYGIETDACVPAVRSPQSAIPAVRSPQSAMPAVRSPQSAIPAVPVAEAVEILAPLLWRHIRSAGHLPDGIERFGAFFSAG